MEQSEPPELGRGAERGRSPQLFGFTGSSLRTLGVVLLVLGGVVCVVGVAVLFSGPPMPSPTDPNFAQASDAWFQASTAHGLGAMAIFVVGMVLFAVGGYALRFGLVRPVASFLASEASPAIETASAAVGRGLAEARGATPTWPTAAPAQTETVVKVKCRQCGHLNEESAKFCDDCGQPL